MWTESGNQFELLNYLRSHFLCEPIRTAEISPLIKVRAHFSRVEIPLKSNAIPPQGDPSNKRSRRSDIEGFSVGMCVLCQSTELDAKGLHQIETA